MSSLNVILLLTGTVNPDGMALTKLQDYNVRKQQYIEAIGYWIKRTDIKIVFVENSDTDLSENFINLINTERIEFLKFNGNNYNKSLGKGYGELKCLEYAVNNSKFISNSDFIFKVTGRYRVLNFNDFIDYFNRNNYIELLVDFKLNLTFADSRFFGFKRRFISDFLIKYKSLVNDSEGIFFEEILAKACLNAISKDYTYRPLHTLPRIMGYSGTLGTKYKSSYLHWLRHVYKYYLKFKSIGLGHLPNI